MSNFPSVEKLRVDCLGEKADFTVPVTYRLTTLEMFTVEEIHELVQGINGLGVVRDNAEWVIVASGATLWEIAETYMWLGLLPPIEVATAISAEGRGQSKKDQWILSGCRMAIRTERDWLTAVLKSMSNFGRQRRLQHGL